MECSLWNQERLFPKLSVAQIGKGFLFTAGLIFRWKTNPGLSTATSSNWSYSPSSSPHSPSSALSPLSFHPLFGVADRWCTSSPVKCELLTPWDTSHGPGHVSCPLGLEPGSVDPKLLHTGLSYWEAHSNPCLNLFFEVLQLLLTRTWILPPNTCKPQWTWASELASNILSYTAAQSKMTKSLLYQRESGISGDLRPLRGTLCRPCSLDSRGLSGPQYSAQALPHQPHG